MSVEPIIKGITRERCKIGALLNLLVNAMGPRQVLLLRTNCSSRAVWLLLIMPMSQIFGVWLCQSDVQSNYQPELT